MELDKIHSSAVNPTNSSGIHLEELDHKLLEIQYFGAQEGSLLIKILNV